MKYYNVRDENGRFTKKPVYYNVRDAQGRFVKKNRYKTVKIKNENHYEPYLLQSVFNEGQDDSFRQQNQELLDYSTSGPSEFINYDEETIDAKEDMLRALQCHYETNDELLRLQNEKTEEKIMIEKLRLLHESEEDREELYELCVAIFQEVFNKNVVEREIS